LKHCFPILVYRLGKKFRSVCSLMSIQENCHPPMHQSMKSPSPPLLVWFSDDLRLLSLSTSSPTLSIVFDLTNQIRFSMFSEIRNLRTCLWETWLIHNARGVIWRRGVVWRPELHVVNLPTFIRHSIRHSYRLAINWFTVKILSVFRVLFGNDFY